MNFGARMLPTSWDYILAQEGYYVWCGSMFHHRDTYYIAYSRWKKEYGFDGCGFIRGSAYYADMHSEKWIPSVKKLIEAVAKEI